MISVIICTHNPKCEIFSQVLDCLAKQTLPQSDWELLIIDNASQVSISSIYSFEDFSNVRVVVESKLGLTNARICGYRESKFELIVFVDDDNLCDPNYLFHAKTIMKQNLTIGAIGGKSIPEFEVDPPTWFRECGLSLGCQDYGDTHLTTDIKSSEIKPGFNYPYFAPIGTGLVIRRKCLGLFIDQIQSDPIRLNLGRKGTSLASGEDNDMVLCLLEAGWNVGYFPDLKIKHLIPAGRLANDYLFRMAYESNKTWVMVLAIHNIAGWTPVFPWTLPLNDGPAVVRHVVVIERQRAEM